MGNAYEFPTVCFSSRDLLLAGYRQIDRIHTIPRRLRCNLLKCYTIGRMQETLVVARAASLIGPSGKSEIGWLDVYISKQPEGGNTNSQSAHFGSPTDCWVHSPMNETARPPDRENALCDIEARHVLREDIVLD